MDYAGRLKFVLLYLTVFTLPMYMRVNNMLLGAFIVIAGIDLILNRRKVKWISVLTMGWPVLCFFFLAVQASFHPVSLSGFGYLEKYWSLLLVPFVILPDHERFAGHIRNIFLALTWGCVVTLIICYTHLAIQMLENGEPLSMFYNWRHVGQRFTAIADTHPTYLGIFVVTAILFLIQERNLRKAGKIALLLFLMLGLFQLASRMPLFLFLFFFIFLLVSRMQMKRWQIGILLTGILICSVLFVLIGGDYMKSRIFSPEMVVDHKRVDRWEVSYEIFQEHPFSGVGYAQVQDIRNGKFREKGYDLAASANYNAHNQFLEYLSTNGALGGFVYAIALAYLFLLSITRQNSLFSLIILAFIIANLTESMLVRIKGIEYFALFASFLLCEAFRAPGKDSGKAQMYLT